MEGHRRRGRSGWLAVTTGLAGGDRIDGAEHVAAAVVLDHRRGGASLVDGDGDERAGEEALIELPHESVDIECAVLADAATRADGERGRELVLVDWACGGVRPRLGRRPTEQPAVRRVVVVLVEE